jgi:hypothetical protein
MVSQVSYVLGVAKHDPWSDVTAEREDPSYYEEDSDYYEDDYSEEY